MGFSPFESSVEDHRMKLIVAGLLTGFGTNFGCGCTSGHGLCGLSRFSIRSLAAVLIFLITAIIVATLDVGEVFVYSKSVDELVIPKNIDVNLYIVGTLITAVLLFIFSANKTIGGFFRTVVYFIVGIMFGLGLMVAGMSQRQNIFGFLELNLDWNPALLVVLMTGVIINVVGFTIIRKGM